MSKQILTTVTIIVANVTNLQKFGIVHSWFLCATTHLIIALGNNKFA